MITKATEVNRQCSIAYQDMLLTTKRALGKGCLRSRGRAVCVLDKAGNILPDYECEQTLWEGTQAQLVRLLRLIEGGNISLISIVMALDYAESVRDWGDFNYDPMVAECDVVIWSADKPD